MERRAEPPGTPSPRFNFHWREKRPEIAIAAVWALSLIWLAPGILLPDAGGYYCYLPSMWLGHDLLFYDEWARMGMIVHGTILHKEVTITGFLGNHWTIGSALFWFPAMVWGDLLRSVVPGLHQFARDGFSLPYNVSAIASSAFAGLLTLLVGFHVATGRVTRKIAAFATIAIWFGSPLLWYSMRHSLMSHAVSALACALVVAASLKTRHDTDGRWFLITGLAIGFAFIVRPQNLAFALVPLILLPGIDRKTIRAALPPLILGTVIASLPEIIVSEFLYATPIGFITGGARSTPFASFQRIWLWEPIFSWYHGMATWTPLLAIAIVGLVLLFRDDRRLAAAAVYAIAAQCLVNATMERSFWGATAFGQRRLSNCTVFFILGAAVFVSRVRKWVSVPLVLAASAWTMSLFFAANRIQLGSYYLPSELFTAQKAAIRSVGRSLVPLASVPPAYRTTTALVAASAILLFAAIAILSVRYLGDPRKIVISAIAYLTVFSVFVLACGFNSLGKRAEYARLIARNRPLALLPGGVEFREGLLRDEIGYLTKAGRLDEAHEDEVELNDLIQARRKAIDALERRNHRGTTDEPSN